MQNFREKFQKHAWLYSLIIVAGYFALFVFPALGDSNAMGHGTGIDGVESMNSQLSLEIFLAVSVLVIIAAIGWWRSVVFHPLNPGGLKFAIAPAIFTAVLLLGAILAFGTEDKTIIQIVGLQQILILVTMTLLVGIYEETLFRGILLNAAITKFTPVTAVLITAVLFGAMHIVNYIGGQPLPDTVVQMIHAAIMGFMYGILVLRVGALWPVILLHGFWDATVALIGTASSAIATEAVTTTPSVSGYDPAAFMMMLPELFYGLFLLWRYTKWQRSRQA